jgi:AcrR family transcriptional regulator
VAYPGTTVEALNGVVNVCLHSHTWDMADASGQARTPRPRNSQATRDQLLRAAMRRFTVLGYDRTTARDVAADAGVNVALINRYFGSKDGLFAEVMRESAHSLEQIRQPQPASVVDAVISQLEPDAWPEFGNEHPLVLLLRDIGGHERTDELRRRSLDAVVEQMVEQSYPDQTSPSPDATLRAELVLALMAGVLTLRAARPGSELAVVDKEVLREILEHATASILEPESARPDPPHRAP